MPTYWPDFDRTVLETAIREYQQREHRLAARRERDPDLVVGVDPVSNSGKAGTSLSASNLALRILSQ